jgi:hypothetical protein
MNNDICFICYDEGYIIKIPCNNCNLFIHPLCLEKLIDNFGNICKVCKSNYILSQEQIIIEPINNIIYNNNEVNEVPVINRRRNIIKKILQIFIIFILCIIIVFLSKYN